MTLLRPPTFSKLLFTILPVFTGIFLLLPTRLIAQIATEHDRYLSQLDYLSLINDTNTPSVSYGYVPVVAVIDEGIDQNNPELQNSIWTNAQGRHGWNFLQNNNNLTPLGKHGTEVAGVIKASANAAGTNIKLMPLIACQDSQGCDVDSINKAIYYAVDNGAQIINLSLASQDFLPDFDDAIAYAYKHGAILIAAAGNGNQNTGLGINLDVNPISPICNSSGQNMILGVTALDQLNQLPSWADFGSCVNVAAPGTNIYTTTNPDYDNGLSYSYEDGTSFATAEVSGLAAVLKAENPNLTNKQIMFEVVNNSEQIFSNGQYLNKIDFAKTITKVNQNYGIAYSTPKTAKKIPYLVKSAKISRSLNIITNLTGYLPIQPR